MKRIKVRITTKIYVLAALSSLVALSGIISLVHRVEEIVNLHDQNIAKYSHKEDVAAQMGINFKKQVQEWKDILLRGNNPEDYEKHKNLFGIQDSLVRLNAEELTNTISDDDIHRKVIAISKEHARIGIIYRMEMESFSRIRTTDPRIIDRRVRGIDRSLTKSIEELGLLIRQSVDTYKAAQQADLVYEKRMIILAASVVFIQLFVMSIVVGFQIGRPIRQLTQTIRLVSESHDYSIRAEVISDDEIGEMVRGFNEMLMQIQTKDHSLQQAKEELEIRVEERTKQLYRLNIELLDEIEIRKKISEEREGVITDLKQALEKIKTLSGLLPICSNCKKIRDDRGYWNRVELYLTEHTGVEFTHGICPECSMKLYGIS